MVPITVRAEYERVHNLPGDAEAHEYAVGQPSANTPHFQRNRFIPLTGIPVCIIPHIFCGGIKMQVSHIAYRLSVVRGYGPQQSPDECFQFVQVEFADAAILPAQRTVRVDALPEHRAGALVPFPAINSYIEIVYVSGDGIHHGISPGSLQVLQRVYDGQ